MATGDEQAGDHEAAHARSVAQKLVVLGCVAVVACASEGPDIPMITGDCLAADDHDEDGDGIPDSCDDCPAVADPAQSDTGEELGLSFRDGVGDACDPQPTRAGDKLAAFHAFATDTSRDWRGDGWRIGADVARAIAPARWQSKAAEQGDGLFVQARASIHWLADGASVRVVVDDGDGVGYACAVVRDRDGDGLDELEVRDGPGTPVRASLGAHVDGPIAITAWRTIDFHREGTVFCRIVYEGTNHELQLEHLDDFSTGVYAFASEGALTDIDSLAVYTFPIGPCATTSRECNRPN